VHIQEGWPVSIIFDAKTEQYAFIITEVSYFLKFIPACANRTPHEQAKPIQSTKSFGIPGIFSRSQSLGIPRTELSSSIMTAFAPYDISIIIVSYNTCNYLARCLESLTCSRQPHTQIIVVDNASQDASLEMVRRRFSSVIAIANSENTGFAAANNQGIAVSQGRYLYFLNPDTEVYPGGLETMIHYMDSHPDIGIAGTALVNPDGSPQPSVEYRYPGEKHAKKALAGLKGKIAWVLGASMIARTEAIKAIGGFDDTFFLYGEEQDLCLRLRKSGWAVGYVPDAVVMHWGGKSERHHTPSHVWEKKFRAELKFYRTHYPACATRRICMENLAQAIWRIATIHLTLPFCHETSLLENKLKKYRTALKIFMSRQ
jgi:GT2 family glycosyltransferase